MTYKHEQSLGPGRVSRRIKAKIKAFGLVVCALALIAPAAARAGSGGVGVGGNGGGKHHGHKNGHHGHKNGHKTVSGKRAKLRHGRAIPPRHAPHRVKRAIRAGNQIAGLPYKYGGGHGRWHDKGYDCSGAVSYVLGRPGAHLLKAPMPSGGFTRGGWGTGGRGKWITTYANSGHMYVMIAGLRFESHTRGDGPGWARQKPTKAGYVKRHAKGL